MFTYIFYNRCRPLCHVWVGGIAPRVGICSAAAAAAAAEGPYEATLPTKQEGDRRSKGGVKEGAWTPHPRCRRCHCLALTVFA